MKRVHSTFNCLLSGAFFILLSGNLFAQMEWLNPYPVGSYLTSAYFKDSLVGYIVGGTDYILKTTDGGTSWKITNVSNSGDLSGVDFIDDLNGFAWGHNLYSTHDGGETWVEATSIPPVEYSLTAHFFNEEVWIIADYGKVFKTFDAGLTWQTVYEHDGDLMNSVFFVNDTVGFLGGNYKTQNVFYSILLKTTDAGNTWIRYHYPDLYSQTTSINFHNQDTGFIATDIGIFKTTDGGNSIAATGVSEFVNAIARINDSVFLASISYPYRIIRSVDGWATWQTVWSQVGRVIYYLAPSGKQCFGVGYAGYNTPVIIKSDNMGLFWQNKDRIVTSKHLSEISFCDSLNGFILGTGNTILHTTDGGVNWDVMTCYNAKDDVFCVNPLVAYYIGSGSMYKTVDGGHNWIFCNSNTPGQTIHFLNPAKGFCAGVNGIVARTLDGGNSWEQVAVVISKLYSIEFVNDNVGYITGDNGTVLKTVDGGITWQDVSISYSTTLCSSSFITEDIGFVAGLGGIYKTNNGGNSWIGLNSSSFYSVRFIDEDHGYAASDGGYISYTVDGGVTWKFYTTGSYSNIRDIEITESGDGYFTGSYGAIIRVNNIYQTLTGDQRIHQSGSFNLYPNPAVNQVTVSGIRSLKGEIKCTIYNIRGEPVMNNIVDSNSDLTIQVGSLPNGLYLVRMTTDKISSVQKLIINH